MSSIWERFGIVGMELVGVATFLRHSPHAIIIDECSREVEIPGRHGVMCGDKWSDRRQIRDAAGKNA